MTKEQYNELKTLVRERLLPLRSQGNGVGIRETFIADGEKMGQETGFIAWANLQGEFYHQERIRKEGDYADAKSRLVKMIVSAEAFEPEEKNYSDNPTLADGRHDRDISESTYGYMGGIL